MNILMTVLMTVLILKAWFDPNNVQIFICRLNCRLKCRLNIKIDHTGALVIWSFERGLRCDWTVFWTVEHFMLYQPDTHNKTPSESPFFGSLAGFCMHYARIPAGLFEALLRAYFGVCNIFCSNGPFKSGPSNTQVSIKSHFDRTSDWGKFGLIYL